MNGCLHAGTAVMRSRSDVGIEAPDRQELTHSRHSASPKISIFLLAAQADRLPIYPSKKMTNMVVTNDDMNVPIAFFMSSFPF
jgi:hypothetical protein